MTKSRLAVTCALFTLLLACDRNTQPDAKPTAQEVEGGAAEASADVEGEATAPKAAESQPADPQPAAKAECIAKPKADAERRHGDSLEDLRVYDVEDLDDDGEKELTVASEGATGAGDHVLYLSNAGCWIFAGEFLGYVPERLSTSTNGKRDFGNYEPNGCMNMEGSIDRYAWDGAKYVVAKSVYCPCPGDDEEADAKRHPDCPEDR
jgi:hypothetical protein